MLNCVCLNSLYTTECSPDIQSHLILQNVLLISNLSSHTSIHPIASDAVDFGTEKTPSNSATSCQTEFEEEPKFAQSDQICNSAHHYPGCYKLVHAICGHSAGQAEGFGSAVWCTECWVDARDVDLLEGSLAAKRGQERQISKMVKQSPKKFRKF